jgi:hypothetical protein
VRFLQPPFSASNLISFSFDPKTDFSTGYVVADISLTHPFPGLDKYTGFDVRGVCIGNGSIHGVKDPGIFCGGKDDLRLINADGFTRWFNPTEFTTYGTILGFTVGAKGTPSTDFSATLNAYKYYCEGLGKDTQIADFFADPGCPNPRGFFPVGSKLTRTFELQFPVPGGVPVYRFQYAVVASWEPPLVNPPSIPEDFTLSANCHEAYVISAVDLSTLYYVDPSTAGGYLSMVVTVYDHQGVQNSGGVHDEIAGISMESQGNLIDGNLAVFEGATLDSALLESNAVFARYSLAVPEPQVNPTESGDMPIMVAVESADPAGYDSGIPGFAFPDGALAAYRLVPVHVDNEAPPPLWEVEVVDSGLSPSLQFNSDGEPCISYHRTGSNCDLMYARRVSGVWQSELVEDLPSESDIFDGTSLDFNPAAGSPSISYLHFSPVGGAFDGKLWFADRSSGSWIAEQVTDDGDVGQHSSLCYDDMGYPCIAYHEYIPFNGGVKAALLMWPVWSIDYVDSDPGETGGVCPSLDFDSLQRPHVSYGAGGGAPGEGELRYGYHDTVSWTIKTIDTGIGGAYPYNGIFTSIKVNIVDSPCIAYRDAINGDLKYAEWKVSDWSIETVDSDGDVGYWCSLALGGSYTPHISYHDLTNHRVKHAVRIAPGLWEIEIVDSGLGSVTGDSDAYTSIDVDSSGKVGIAYYDALNSNLKYAEPQ